MTAYLEKGIKRIKELSKYFELKSLNDTTIQVD